MEIPEFVEATTRLEKYYGKEYTDYQRKTMHDELGNMDIERYRQLISAIIRKSSFLPKIADFVKADIEEPYPNRTKEIEKVECQICNGEGIIHYKNFDSETGYTYDYGCRCTCENGRRRNSKIHTYEELGIIPEPIKRSG